MAQQIYNKTFCGRNYGNEGNARNRALEAANNFFIEHDSVDVVNVVESWDEKKEYLYLIVYYKGYI